MSSVRDHVLVIGDALLEEDGDKKHLGGAGNLAANLSKVLPEYEIWLPLPYTLPRDQKQTGVIYPLLCCDHQLLNWMTEKKEREALQIYGRRKRNGPELLESFDPDVDWVYLFRHAVSVKEFLKTFIETASMLVLEWHYPGNQSIASIVPSLLKEMASSGQRIPILYLDMRHPDKALLDSLFAFSKKPSFWKMNGEEKEKFASQTPDLAGRNVVLLETLGKDGARIKLEELEVDIAPSHHPHVFPIGCGDTYSAYFIGSILREKEMNIDVFKRSGEIATMAAGLACSLPEVACIDPLMVLNDYYRWSTENK